MKLFVLQPIGQNKSQEVRRAKSTQDECKIGACCSLVCGLISFTSFYFKYTNFGIKYNVVNLNDNFSIAFFFMGCSKAMNKFIYSFQYFRILQFIVVKKRNLR